MTALGADFTILWFLATAVLVALAIAWLILPFALFGTRPLLRELLAESRRTNELLEQIRLQGRSGAGSDPLALKDGRAEPYVSKMSD